MTSPIPSPLDPSRPETDLPVKGAFRVWAEMRNQLDQFGDRHFSADRSTIEHWEGLLAAEMADDLKARLPETLRLIEGIDRAKFVSRKILNTQIDV